MAGEDGEPAAITAKSAEHSVAFSLSETCISQQVWTFFSVFIIAFFSDNVLYGVILEQL